MAAVSQGQMTVIRADYWRRSGFVSVQDDPHLLCRSLQDIAASIEAIRDRRHWLWKRSLELPATSSPRNQVRL
jgi:hypothetical protein